MADPIDKTQMQCPAKEAPNRIAENWRRVSSEVATATRTAGRDPSEVRVVGVSKYVDAEITSWLVEAGCCDLGENRPQALQQKYEWFAQQRSDLAANLRWHQIGHLQRNKVRSLLASGAMIHSIDSERLLNEVAEEATRQAISVDVLIEINVSGEAAKTGLPPAELSGLLDRYCSRRAAHESPTCGVHVLGLMAMAGWGTDLDQARPQFARLRELRDQIAAQTGFALNELSMGMSGDYEAAIAEGATMVRIGSNLFTGVL